MATMRDVEEMQRGYAEVQRLLERDIRQVWQSVDPSDRARFRQVILTNVSILVDEYGKVNAALAADFFEATIGRPPVLVPSPPREVVEASTRWAIGPAFPGQEPIKDESGKVVGYRETPPNQAKALTAVTASAARHARQAGRDTVRRSALESRGVAYARMLTGDKNCAFCVTMAGRGAVYEESTAKSGTLRKAAGGGLAEAFHDYCDCATIAVRGESDWPEGYDHKKVENLYNDALKKVDSTKLKGGQAGVPRKTLPPADMSILQYMRETHGFH